MPSSWPPTDRLGLGDITDARPNDRYIGYMDKRSESENEDSVFTVFINIVGIAVPLLSNHGLTSDHLSVFRILSVECSAICLF